tara:strand:- start:424 stop:903 length:480 start_codon:yes stop_codon:yes gene_type:complete
MHDYGSAWRILRLKSLTDQIFIKAQRIRSIDDKGVQKIKEGIDEEFMGILNYSIIALIQLSKKSTLQPDMSLDESILEYKEHATIIKNLMEQKNHDYGEAWKEMRISSFTDLILQKLHRIKQIEDNDGETIISEGIDANYHDIVNYSIFALIQLKEKND